MGFFGEEISDQKVELEVPENYTLKLLQGCIAPSVQNTEAVTTLFVQTVNEEMGFALFSLGGSKTQPVRFCSLQHEFGPEDCPLVLYTNGEKIHLTGSWSWTADAEDIDDDEDNEYSCDEEISEYACDEGQVDVEGGVEEEVPIPEKKSMSNATSNKRKRQEERGGRAEELDKEQGQGQREDGDGQVKKTTRNKRGGKQDSVVLPASELVAVSKPPASVDTELKLWKVKPQNNEGIPVPAPKQKTLKTGVLITDYVVGNGAEPKLGSSVKITYEGMFPNGKVFDKNQSRKKPLKFRIGSGQVIRGLDLGMDKMRVGGSREIVIPPALGYGKDGIGDIPGNQVLVFRISLVGIEKKSLSKR